MKNIIFVILQTLLLLLTFAVGSFLWHPFGVQTTISSTPPVTRLFVWDGILLMLLVFGLIVFLEAMRKRVRSAVPWSVLALALATLLGLLSKFGIITHDF